VFFTIIFILVFCTDWIIHGHVVWVGNLIYWSLLIQSLAIIINYNNSQYIFNRNLLPWLPRTRSILIGLSFSFDLIYDSKSEWLYDWRFTAHHFILASSSLRRAFRVFSSFLLLGPCGNRHYVTSSLTRRWVCLLWIYLTFRQAYVSHLQHVIENSSFCTTYKSSVSTGFANQIIHILRILCYNGSLVTWTVVSLTPNLGFSLYSLVADPIENTAS
jgi:hypothetical protein